MRGSIKFILLSLTLYLVSSIANAQSYSYVQYGINDGLSSPAVYSMLQDKDGFMWFGTEGGLNRFDGTHFKAFTTKDGLPDNEILKMFQDSKGRIWMLPFKNSICYYLNGKFYNQKNDTVLKKLSIKERVLNVLEDSVGTIWISDVDAIHKIYKNGTIERIEYLNGIRLNQINLLAMDDQNRIWASSLKGDTTTIFKIQNGATSLYTTFPFNPNANEVLFAASMRIWYNSVNSFVIESDKFKLKEVLPHSLFIPQTNYSFVNDSIFSINTYKGAYLYDIKNNWVTDFLLTGKSITNVLQDRENNIWISTLRDGLFRLQSKNLKNIIISKDNVTISHISSIDKIENSLYIGTQDLKLAILDKNLNPTFVKIDTAAGIYDNKIMGVFNGKPKIFFIASRVIFELDDKNVSKPIENGKLNGHVIPFPKYVCKKNDTIIIATISNVIRFGISKLEILDTIWEGRTTAVHEKGGSFYIGTLNGLYKIDNHKRSIFLGDQFPLFKNRITCFEETKDGSLWVGMNDDGVIQFKNDSIKQHYSTTNGLSNNTCRTISADGDFVWIGTDKGLNKIKVNDTLTKIAKITKSDGLSSDLVSKIFVDGDTIFVGTSEGLNFFNKKLVDQYSECVLKVFDITNGNALLQMDSTYTLNNRNLKINYVGISYKSAGEITYRYRLQGIDTAWQTTTETTLEFVSLPYGQQALEIIAKNKFGIESLPVVVKLYIPTPFVKSIWFYSLLAIAFIGMVFLLYKRRLGIIEKREKEKTELFRKIAEMELTALRAQMNPHFIFNVLNSIQYFIAYKDINAAQSYLAKFAKLIRYTLEHSKNIFIKLEDELTTLKIYLDLEKMRFENEFEYAITVDKQIDCEKMSIPSMLLQPFIENSIKHGFPSKQKNSRIDINITETIDSLLCVIQDNGIGIVKSKELNLKNNHHHKSAGVAMVADKVEALNRFYKYSLFIETIDLTNEAEKTSGTKVMIRIPKKSIG